MRRQVLPLHESLVAARDEAEAAADEEDARSGAASVAHTPAALASPPRHGGGAGRRSESASVPTIYVGDSGVAVAGALSPSSVSSTLIEALAAAAADDAHFDEAPASTARSRQRAAGSRGGRRSARAGDGDDSTAAPHSQRHVRASGGGSALHVGTGDAFLSRQAAAESARAARLAAAARRVELSAAEAAAAAIRAATGAESVGTGGGALPSSLMSNGSRRILERLAAEGRAPHAGRVMAPTAAALARTSGGAAPGIDGATPRRRATGSPVAIGRLWRAAQEQAARRVALVRAADADAVAQANGRKASAHSNALVRRRISRELAAAAVAVACERAELDSPAPAPAAGAPSRLPWWMLPLRPRDVALVLHHTGFLSGAGSSPLDAELVEAAAALAQRAQRLGSGGGEPSDDGPSVAAALAALAPLHGPAADAIALFGHVWDALTVAFVPQFTPTDAVDDDGEPLPPTLSVRRGCFDPPLRTVPVVRLLALLHALVTDAYDARPAALAAASAAIGLDDPDVSPFIAGRRWAAAAATQEHQLEQQRSVVVTSAGSIDGDWEGGADADAGDDDADGEGADAHAAGYASGGADAPDGPARRPEDTPPPGRRLLLGSPQRGVSVHGGAAGGHAPHHTSFVAGEAPAVAAASFADVLARHRSRTESSAGSVTAAHTLQQGREDNFAPTAADAKASAADIRIVFSDGDASTPLSIRADDNPLASDVCSGALVWPLDVLAALRPLYTNRLAFLGALRAADAAVRIGRRQRPARGVEPRAAHAASPTSLLDAVVTLSLGRPQHAGSASVGASLDEECTFAPLLSRKSLAMAARRDAERASTIAVQRQRLQQHGASGSGPLSARDAASTSTTSPPPREALLLAYRAERDARAASLRAAADAAELAECSFQPRTNAHHTSRADAAVPPPAAAVTSGTASLELPPRHVAGRADVGTARSAALYARAAAAAAAREAAATEARARREAEELAPCTFAPARQHPRPTPVPPTAAASATGAVAAGDDSAPSGALPRIDELQHAEDAASVLTRGSDRGLSAHLRRMAASAAERREKEALRAALADGTLHRVKSAAVTAAAAAAGGTHASALGTSTGPPRATPAATAVAGGARPTTTVRLPTPVTAVTGALPAAEDAAPSTSGHAQTGDAEPVPPAAPGAAVEATSPVGESQPRAPATVEEAEPALPRPPRTGAIQRDALLALASAARGASGGANLWRDLWRTQGASPGRPPVQVARDAGGSDVRAQRRPSTSPSAAAQRESLNRLVARSPEDRRLRAREREPLAAAPLTPTALDATPTATIAQSQPSVAPAATVAQPTSELLTFAAGSPPLMYVDVNVSADVVERVRGRRMETQG